MVTKNVLSDTTKKEIVKRAALYAIKIVPIVFLILLYFIFIH